jgi:hypothetical protein
MLKDKNISFSTDSDNQLLVKVGNSPSRVVPGRFKVEDNSLIYLADEPDGWQRDLGLPEKIRFRGSWRLNKEHNLIMLLDEGPDRLTLRGRILHPEGNIFNFWLRSVKFGDTSNVSLIKLTGIWRADKFNRLAFEVTQRQSQGTLALRAIWDVGKDHQITYRYEQLKTKEKITLDFKGVWDILDKNKIGYQLEAGKENQINFRAYLQTPNLYPARKKIKYRLGVGIAHKRKERLLVLDGDWKLSRTGGLSYEIDYGEGRIKRIRFGAEVNLAGRDKLSFSLSNIEGRPLGITVTFTKKSLSEKDWEYFIRARKQGKEVYLGGGFRFKF